MAISLTEDIRFVTELKRNMQEILDHMHKIGRPVILTVKVRRTPCLSMSRRLRSI